MDSGQCVGLVVELVWAYTDLNTAHVGNAERRAKQAGREDLIEDAMRLYNLYDEIGVSPQGRMPWD